MNGVRDQGIVTYSRPDSTHVLLEGALLGDPVSIKLRAIDLKVSVAESRFSLDSGTSTQPVIDAEIARA